MNRSGVVLGLSSTLSALLLTAQGLIPTVAVAEARDITLTLVRHAQSAGNASGVIDSSVPGPELTPLGQCQAAGVATVLDNEPVDGVFASTMIRTQETAQPLADAVHQRIEVLPGLREIEAGIYEGTPEADARDTYFQAPLRWLRGDRSARIPGSVDGNDFDARFGEAIRAIYDSGKSHPIAFSHGAAIMLWAAMNVRGVDPALIQASPLANTGYLVMRGNPATGWDLLQSQTQADTCPVRP